PPAMAVATNKLVASCGATSAAATFVHSKRYTPEVVLKAIPFTIVGALIGAFSLTTVPKDLLKPIIAIVITGLAIYFWLRPQMGLTSTYTTLTKRLSGLVFAGAFIIGFYDGFLGPGTGTFLMFLMVRGLGFDFVHAAGNTKVLNWASNITALVLFLITGKIFFAAGLPMAAANLLGGYLGAHTAIRKGSTWIRWIYLIMALALVVRLLWR
ncbi:MAG: TSUP family transporter, partial [bacterium]